MSLHITRRSIARMAAVLGNLEAGKHGKATVVLANRSAPTPGVMSLLDIEHTSSHLNLCLRCQGTTNTQTLPSRTLEPTLNAVCDWIERCANEEMNQEVA